MSHALEHYLERAAQIHLASFDSWFPATFDWARLCADVPAMSRGLGHDAPEGGDRTLEDMAGVVFRGAHLFALAVLGAAAQGEADPDHLLQRLASPCGDEEEEAFGDLVGCCLRVVEDQVFADAPPPETSDRVDRAADLVRAVWPAVTHILAADDSRIFERAGQAADVLWGVARVGVILAAFRWMAAEEYASDWPELPLDA